MNELTTDLSAKSPNPEEFGIRSLSLLMASNPNCSLNVGVALQVHPRRSLEIRATLKILVEAEVFLPRPSRIESRKSSSAKSSDDRTLPLPHQNNWRPPWGRLFIG
ncbi:hypothetical protein PIB30_025036 [Stylosanthes scabra]|uniref:Uncharacterized protein n=1 Tax=Stylosanthes scabra TaxID=79078 RepID=A0ABU6RA62_9FABA|nr:hypothetical protein [Stylosanthes scabra]